MGETLIEWTSTRRPDGTRVPGYTFNPWRGCTKVSAGCRFCYADAMSGRNHLVLGVWGPKGSRPVAADAYWRKPLAWDLAARESGERRRVFCASLADVFEGEDTMPPSAVASVAAARRRLFETIDATPHLDWLLLTKRPENVERLWPFGWYDDRFTWPNVWIGTSIEDQAAADRRIPPLMKIPAAVRFLSCEPLIGPVDLDLSYPCPTCEGRGGGRNFTSLSLDDGAYDCGRCDGTGSVPFQQIPDWVICGGESGPDARPMHPDWARSLRVQCEVAGVGFFFKQWGEWKPISQMSEGEADALYVPAPKKDPEATRRCRVERAVLQLDGRIEEAFPKGAMTVYKVGKKTAGRVMDGRTWDESPSPVREGGVA